MKRGQVTLFIIFGIILLLLAGFILYARTFIIESKIEKVPTDILPVTRFIESCLEQTAMEGLFILGKQGGYYNLPDKSSPAFSTEFNPYDTEKAPVVFYVELSPYYYYKGKDLMPDLVFIETELSHYIEDNINNCISNLTLFKKQGYIFNFDNPIIDSKFLQNKTTTKMNYPIQIKKGSLNFELDTFSKDINFDFITKYKIAKNIIEKQNRTFIPLGFITNLGYENNFKFEISTINGEDTFLVLIFNETLYAENYIYTFIIRS